VARTFFYTQAWASEGRQEFENFRKKAVFLIVSGKKEISPLLAPLEKLLKKSTSAPLDKILPMLVHTSIKITQFCKNCAVLHHLATLFHNTNALSKP